MKAARKLIAPLVILPICLAVLPTPSTAQSFTIEAAQTLPVSIASPTPLAIHIPDDAELPKQSSVLIRGLPLGLSLNKGRLFSSGAWYVSVGDLADLMLVPSDGLAARPTPLSVSLQLLDGTILAERKIMLDVGAADREQAATTNTATAAAPPAQATAAERSQLPGLSIPKEEEARRLERGIEALELNDIAGARLIFEYLANHGSAVGAYHLARTYDPELLPQTSLGPQFKPDADIAQRWYARAAELGHRGAINEIARRQ